MSIEAVVISRAKKERPANLHSNPYTALVLPGGVTQRHRGNVSNFFNVILLYCSKPGLVFATSLICVVSVFNRRTVGLLVCLFRRY